MDSALIHETYGVRIACSSFVSAFFFFKGGNLGFFFFFSYFVCHVLCMPLQCEGIYYSINPVVSVFYRICALQ